MRFNGHALSCGCCGGVRPALQAVDVEAFNDKPMEAIAFLRDKLRVPTATWTDIWQEMHSAAFVVAGAQSDDLLKDFQDAVLKAIEQGTTLEEFRKDFDAIVADHGWSYNGSRNWRSRVIFQTNLRMAYASGRWQQIERVKETRPYLRYVAVLDARTRPWHRAWHDTVLPVDHPWWQTHFPPNGWNCRCSVQSVNERDLFRYKLKVSDEAPPINWVERLVGSGAARRAIRVPEGIDPGFAYRPGTPPSDVVRQWLAGRAD
jgi:SPP1 gp7 family putative phage head morphogenesis protein